MHAEILEVRQVVDLEADATGTRRAARSPTGVAPFAAPIHHTSQLAWFWRSITRSAVVQNGSMKQCTQRSCCRHSSGYAFVEVLAHLEATAVHLVEHLVRILDEVLEALEELDREPVRPHDDVGMAVQAEDLLQAGQVLDGIVEELVAILERRALRDDVQEVELADAHRQAERDDLVDVRHVLLADADVDVDDDPSVADGAHHALHQPVEGALRRR